MMQTGSNMPFLNPSQIEKIADKVRSTYGFESELNLDITKLAERIGLTVYEADFGTDEITGKIQGTNIYVNMHDSEPRKRFTIAHELAHYILHQNGDIDHIDYRMSREYYSEDELQKEVQANMLAASLLMPEKLVKEIWEFLKDVDEVADKFKVSKKAATIRLDSLHLLE